MKNAILAAGFIVTFVTVPAQSVHAETGGRLSLETGMHYDTGKYGGTQSTDILYVPVIGKYQDKEWTLKMTVPYLQISGPGNVVAINGTSVTGATTANTRATRSGLGDVIVSATRNVYDGGSSGFGVDLTGKVKFGTASSANGLGTGKNDYAFLAELYQDTGNLSTFGTLGYRVYGSPAGYSLNKVFFGSLGGSYRFGPKTNGGIMLEGGQKITATGSSRLEAILFISHKIEKNWKARGYVLKGFTNSVPDWGAGATIGYLF